MIQKRAAGTSFDGDRAIEGTFGVLLQAGLYDNFVPTAVSLTQTGLVPEDAQSLLFKAHQTFPSASRPFEVSLGGQVLVLAPLEVTANYTLYGATISQYANQSHELRFTAYTFDGGLNNLNLDSIVFAHEMIPEPSTLGFFAFGTLLLGWRFLWRRKH